MSYLLKALIAKLQGEVEVAKANIQVYLHNSAGIGEHPDIVEAMEVQIEKIANAEEKIETIQVGNQYGTTHGSKTNTGEKTWLGQTNLKHRQSKCIRNKNQHLKLQWRL